MPNIISTWVGNSQLGMEVDGPIWVKFNFPLGAAEWFSDMIGQNYFVHSFALSWLQIRNFLRDIRGEWISLRNSRKKLEAWMAFSEAELVFLALIFIYALGFLMSSLGWRNDTSTVKKTKKKRKGRKRATRRHCQEQQFRTPRGPDENDDGEPYNPRGTILWWDFLMLLLLIHHTFLEVMTIYTLPFYHASISMPVNNPRRCINNRKVYLWTFFRKLWELVSNRKNPKDDVLRLLSTLAKHYYWQISPNIILLGSCEEK